MGTSYIERKRYEIQLKRTELLKEMNLTDFEKYTGSKPGSSRSFKRRFASLKDMKIACIMDEFTFNSFEPECSILQVTPQDWLRQIRSFEPDLFFLESAWRGVDGLWNTKVPHLSNELIDLLSYCKKNNIPIVFWNKEDPVHFDTFLATAKYVDFVFTTDIDCIQKYKTLLNHDRVYLMPFAAQLKYHNPIELYDRQDKYCFAGAYYKRYPDRIRDLETFIDTITRSKDLDIYDRNFYGNDPNYAFPSEYKKFIIGNLKPNEIDKAYKGYRFNINLNSVKQSQSMCARRVFELLASNTVTVSNYSRAIRNMLGDLVVCTDDGKHLGDHIDKFTDIDYYNKFRLLGLRKVLSEHTYSKRLEYLVNVVYENKLEPSQKRVAIISKVDTEQQLNRIIDQFQSQSYSPIELFLVTGSIGLPQLELKRIHLLDVLTKDTAAMIQEKFDYISYFSPDDYYGDNYIKDLILATDYTDFEIISKSAHYTNKGGILKEEGVSYKVTNSISLRRALISSRYNSVEKIVNFCESIEYAVIQDAGFSIDEYNYCENYLGDKCPIVDDLKLTDQGIPVKQIYEKAEKIKQGKKSNNSINITSDEIFNRLDKSKKVLIKKEADGLYVESRLQDSHEYLYFDNVYDAEKFGPSTDLYLDVEFYSKFNVDIVALLLDRHNQKIEAIVKPSSRKISIKLGANVKYIKFGIRFAGDGVCKIKSLFVGDIHLDEGCFLNKSNILLISDNYPDYENLYRYGFIHSRLTEYKKSGHIVDMFKFNERHENGYSEFGGIDITNGYFEEFNNLAMNGEYDTFLIHFINETIWNGVKNYIGKKKTIIWVHGSEIQPWWRRDYNYSTPQQLEKAKKDSEKRLLFWEKVFAAALSGNYDIHFVFVSNYFAEEVFEDHKIKLPKDKYSIIPNYINTELFSYTEKDIELRKKVLSIRPFASNKYANDLTIKAIQHLAKDPVFKQLEFTIMGQGQLFQSLVKPIRKYKNVKLEERFLRQEEIAAIHKEYGIFLVPTRMDSQGVSRDEAMSSGLVPITNNVAAIPEFVDENCGMLVDEEDYVGLAESIKALYQDPQYFLQLSQSAAERVKKQSGREETIMKELLLMIGDNYTVRDREY